MRIGPFCRMLSPGGMKKRETNYVEAIYRYANKKIKNKLSTWFLFRYRPIHDATQISQDVLPSTSLAEIKPGGGARI